ncbi:MAG TPA: FmdE family protein [Pyrinomonadaceae bacterium]|nr:FmdE family protein [Pyrinomonadaceae bacterium]
MESLEVLLQECERLHGHMCAGQLLGARMALLGCRMIGVDDPRGADRKKLIVWVEIDRCMADAVSAVTGVRLGKRSLKYVDYGKVAATFLNTETDRAVRIVALESARTLADERFADIANKRERQFRAYSESTDEDLFKVELVSVALSDFDTPGSPRSRVICAVCGEGVNDGREVIGADGDPVCRGCDRGNYYSKVDNPTA